MNTVFWRITTHPKVCRFLEFFERSKWFVLLVVAVVVGGLLGLLANTTTDAAQSRDKAILEARHERLISQRRVDKLIRLNGNQLSEISRLEEDVRLLRTQVEGLGGKPVIVERTDSGRSTAGSSSAGSSAPSTTTTTTTTPPKTCRTVSVVGTCLGG